MIEVLLTTTTQLSSVEIQVAPMIAAGKLQKRAAANSGKAWCLIVSAVLSLQWAPSMPQSGRAKAVCNAGIKSCNLCARRLFHIP